MFKGSGMNHFIGGWHFPSMEYDAGSLGVFCDTLKDSGMDHNCKSMKNDVRSLGIFVSVG